MCIVDNDWLVVFVYGLLWTCTYCLVAGYWMGKKDYEQE